MPEENNQTYHIPALLQPTIEALGVHPEGIYADATFGGGGHSRAILERLGTDGHLYSFDQDADAMQNTFDDPRFTFVRGNFRYMENFLRYYGAGRIDGIVADLGVSFHHFDDPSRGFSFRSDSPLDMRMNRDSRLTAAGIVNSYSEQQLTSLFALYTDLRNPSRFARAICSARQESPIETTSQLASSLSRIINPRQEKKELSQAFQALRIEVNGEMDALAEFLRSTVRILRPEGRIAILTYHSIEDRMVKNFFRYGNIEGKEEKDFFGRRISPLMPLIKNAITPDAAEIERNPRSRSAKLRAAVITPQQDD